MWVRLNCFLRRRHHYRLRISKGRMYMQCADCGYRSQGWEMGPKARPLTPHSPRPSTLRLTLDDAPVAPDAEVSIEPPRTSLPPSDELRFQLDS